MYSVDLLITSELIQPGAVARLYADGRGFESHVRQNAFLETGHDIISTANLFF